MMHRRQEAAPHAMLIAHDPVIPMMFAYRTPSTRSTICDAVLRGTVAGVSVLLMLLLFSSNSAQAQANDAPAHWTQHADEQVAELIESTNPALRTDGMQLLIKLSDEQGASGGFSETRAALYSVVFNHTYSEEQRILALSALHAISDDRVTRALADEVNEVSSDRLRRHILLALEQQT